MALPEPSLGLQVGALKAQKEAQATALIAQYAATEHQGGIVAGEEVEFSADTLAVSRGTLGGEQGDTRG